MSCSDAAHHEALANGIAVVALIGEQIAGLGFSQRYYLFERRAVGRFTSCEVESERGTGGITEAVNLTGEPAPRAAKSLFTSPPLAPAADTWLWTVVLSMLW